MSSESSESLEQVERQMVGLQPIGAPRELRAVVLAYVDRELRSARWDRRLARAAAVLLAVGMGLNGLIGMRSMNSGDALHPIARTSSQSLLETAVVVAEATDAATGLRFARQLAAIAGAELTTAEEAAIDAALQRAAPPATANGHKG